MSEYSNIITPPDFSPDNLYSVLLVDPTWDEVNTLAIFLKTADKAYNIYVYQNEMNNEAWLLEAFTKVDVAVINTVANPLSPTKDKLLIQRDAFYYGPKNFLMNKNRIERVMDYFVLTSTSHQLEIGQI